jgi:5-methylcytosine-specific restriction endonuclease McrA
MYYLDHHELYKYTDKEQRAVIRGAMTHERRDEVMAKRLKQQHNLCFYCGDAIDMAAHLDHIIPVCYGGTNKLANLVAACRSCNIAKNTDQVEITNPRTIADYLKLIEAHKKWVKKVNAGKAKLRYAPKRERLYHIYSAKNFKSVRIQYA